LLDKFLFDEAMDDPENVKTMLDIILSKKTNLKHPPQTEKEQRTSTDNRQIRLDVYAMDEDDVIYEVEAQKENTHNLPKRSRLYQGIIDSKLLLPGGIPRTDRTIWNTVQMKCQNSAKVNGFKRCIDEFVGLKQVKKQR